MPPRFELIVADLDGTLVQRDLTILPRDLEALRRARAAGADFTVATGRNVAAAAPYLRQAEVKLPVILFNGAVVFDPRRGEVLLERRIAPETARWALDLVREFDLEPQLYVDPREEGFLVERLSPRVEEFAMKDRIAPRVVPELAARLGPGPLKFLLIGPREELLRYRRTLERAGVPLTAVLSERTFLELLSPGTSKGAALRWLCRRLGVPLERVLALGDNPNDAEMLEAAGLGLAVEGGDPALRAAADGVVPGVAAGIERALFGDRS